MSNLRHSNKFTVHCPQPDCPWHADAVYPSAAAQWLVQHLHLIHEVSMPLEGAESLVKPIREGEAPAEPSAQEAA